MEQINTLQEQITNLKELLLICFVSTWVVLAAIAYLITNIHDRS